jgi:hypothetical protein
MHKLQLLAIYPQLKSWFRTQPVETDDVCASTYHFRPKFETNINSIYYM